MSRLEIAVHAQFAAQPPITSQRPVTPTASSSTRQEEGVRTETPFAKVNSVVSNSPAADAGLQVGDRVIRFGIATWLNHEKLSKVAQIVSQNEGVSHPILIQKATGLILHGIERHFRGCYEGLADLAVEPHTKVKLGRTGDVGLSSCNVVNGVFTCQLTC
jgi:hypothetical protein